MSLRESPTTSDDWFKACCADIYSSDLVSLSLGPSYHPGGRELTRRLARMACLRPGERVLDVASGPGGSAILLAQEFGASVRGVDLSPALVRAARDNARATGEDIDITFETGDAERLPIVTASVDAVLCECALCTFPDKGAAVSEFVRVLAPGGRLLLSDVVIRGELPEELRSAAARVACLADARSLDGYLELLERSGLRICILEQHDDAVLEIAERIDGRLAMLAAAGPIPGLDLAGARRMVASATKAIEAGAIGYVALTAEVEGVPAA